MTVKSLSGKFLDVGAPAIPCGLVAKSMFNDTYELWTAESTPTNVTIDDSNIAWESDKKYKFKNIDTDLPTGESYKDVQWKDMEDGKFYFAYSP